MRTVIRIWGNSLAIRTPKAFAVHMGIDSGKEVELSLERGGLHITPPARQLDRLLDEVTADNLHGETSTSGSLGREVW
ncbi:AbrB/MazE/SpoVT family DNA-binding domain-containing protein [Candidatus Peregrinibacteria bacterium]|nr:AbrB/MazE/SpoVT family DNA-binding domain-containing protein [Candidatus Peregrinibacteria bacterium]MBI3816523.1 AbrB/MazE/SpoVT family DNA-binding domain-containing protein [Candidatus Peregrinibacteria bacterium]